jgi:hypothetical protein
MLLVRFTEAEADAIIQLSREKRRPVGALIRFACRKLLLDRRGARFSKQ